MKNIYFFWLPHWLRGILGILLLVIAANTAHAQTKTAAPVITAPSNGLTNGKPTYAGTATVGSIVTVYVDGANIGTATATDGRFSLTQLTNLIDGNHQVYATAQASGQLVSASSNTNSFLSDATPPTVVSVTRLNPTTNLTNATSVTFRVVFSEAVTGALGGSPYRAVNNGTTGGVMGGASSSGGNEYSILVGGVSGNGTIGLSVRPFDTTLGVGITDLAGNRFGGFFTGTGEVYTIDQTPPTVTSLTSPNGSNTVTSPIPFAVTFSESVTSLAASSIAISNGFLAGNISGSGRGPYTFNVTPSNDGPVNVRIATNAARDAAGNGNSASGTVSVVYTAPIASTTWTGSINNDWFTASNWTAGVPTSTLNVTIPGGLTFYPLISAGTATVRSLTINVGATLNHRDGTLDISGDLTNNGTFTPTGGTVVLGNGASTNIFGSSTVRFWNLTINASGTLLGTSAGAIVQQVLTLTGTFTTQGNAFTLESNASSTALVVNSGGVITGNTTVQRYLAPDLNPGLGYRHFSSPVSNLAVTGLTTSSFTPVVNPNYNTAASPTQERPFPTIFGYDQSRLTLTNSLSAFDKGWVSPTSLTAILTPGLGYTVNLAADQTLNVNGPVNNDVISLVLSRNSGAMASDAGWALVGNPYPAPLDYSLVAAADRAGLDPAIYVFESASQYGGSYRASLNGVGGNVNSPNSVLAMGQAFFVRVSAGQTSGTLTFRNSQRLTSYVNPTYHRTAETRPLVQLTLQGTGNALADDAYIYFERGATDGFESDYDAVKLANSTGLNLSTSLSGQQLAIDGRGELGTTPHVLPLAVGVPVVGTYTLKATQLLNLTNVPVYLRDVQLGTLIDLHQQANYQFTVTNAAALNTTRFELVFSPQRPLAAVSATLTQQVNVYPNPAESQVTVELPAGLSREPVAMTLVDAVGRIVHQQQLSASGSTHALYLNDLPPGIYSLRLTTALGTFVKKLVIK